jgi:hypothetical protein
MAVTAVVAAGAALYFAGPTADNLRAWGQEREARGDYAGAFDVYRRAWEKAEGADRHAARADVVRCIRRVDDPKTAVAAARAVIAEDPHASFGRYDHLVALAVVAELKARAGGAVASAGAADRPLVELAEKRLKVFLNSGGGSAEERREAEQTLAAAAFVLAGRPYGPVPPEPTEDFGLPTGTPDELRKRAADPKLGAGDRGKAAFVLAKAEAEAGRTDAAKVAAAQAFELLRAVYPMYAGVAASTVISPGSDNRIGREAAEAGLLRQAHDLARRLDPARPAALRGGIRFRIEGVDLPADLAVSVNIVLTAPGVKPDPSFLPHRTVPFRKDRAEVGVADGTYALRVEGRSLSIPPGKDRFARFLELDYDRLPKTVSVAGGFIDLTIPARELAEVELLGPEAGAAFDPAADLLRWAAVPGAAYYRVHLSTQQDYKDGRSVTGLPDITVKGTRVCPGAVDDAHAALRMKMLRPGQIAAWSVEVFDKDDRKIAVSREYGRPLVLAKGASK